MAEPDIRWDFDSIFAILRSDLQSASIVEEEEPDNVSVTVQRKEKV